MADFFGSCTITSNSDVTCDGIFVSIGERIDALQVRVGALEDQIDEIPTNTDFLKPEDVQPMYNDREVLFDV